MARPLGMKHTEADKVKMRKPHKKLSAAECEARSKRQLLYLEAKRAFIDQYVAKREIVTQ
jgi:hypothetical protein